MRIVARSVLLVIASVIASPVARACFRVVPNVEQGFEQAEPDN